MGSLMAGWNTSTLDPNKVRLERNRSLTKEEIEAFKNTLPERPLDPQGMVTALKPSQAAPISPRFVHRGADYTVDVNKARKTGDWWMRSNWAFLNEAMSSEDDPRRILRSYTPQFHVSHNPRSTKASFGVFDV